MSPHSVPMLVNCQTSHLSSFKLSWFMWIGDLVFRGLCGVSDLMLSTRTLHSIIMWPTVTLELLPAAAANNYCLWHHSQVVLKVSCHMLLCKQLPPQRLHKMTSASGYIPCRLQEPSLYYDQYQHKWAESGILSKEEVVSGVFETNLTKYILCWFLVPCSCATGKGEAAYLSLKFGSILICLHVACLSHPGVLFKTLILLAICTYVLLP